MKPISFPQRCSPHTGPFFWGGGCVFLLCAFAPMHYQVHWCMCTLIAHPCTPTRRLRGQGGVPCFPLLTPYPLPHPTPPLRLGDSMMQWAWRHMEGASVSSRLHASMRILKNPPTLPPALHRECEFPPLRFIITRWLAACCRLLIPLLNCRHMGNLVSKSPIIYCYLLSLL